MFTGIIEAVGKVKSNIQIQGEWRLDIDTGDLDMTDVSLGDSIAVNGCCLTVVQKSKNAFLADVSNETMRCTALNYLTNGVRVNLEKAMLATDRFGGHLVSGHVDGVGSLINIEPEGKSLKMTFKSSPLIDKYIAAKGSICIDGTSLTVNEIVGEDFTINVIPHTQVQTIIGDYEIGRLVNLEVDIISRYLERLTKSKSDQKPEKIDLEFLKSNGYE